MSILLNILWLIFGGFVSATGWFIASLIMLVTIIGIPWARATFNIGLLALWPFGSRIVSREKISGEDIGTGPLGFLGNVIWFIIAGWWLFLYHLGWALLMAITIIGIPFAVQYWKLALISLFPIGKAVSLKK